MDGRRAWGVLMAYQKPLKDFRKRPKPIYSRCDEKCPTRWPLGEKQESCEHCWRTPAPLPYYGPVEAQPPFWEGEVVKPMIMPRKVKENSRPLQASLFDSRSA